MDFSTPYFASGTQFIAKKSVLKSPEQLNSLRIGADKGTTNEQQVRAKFPNATIVAYDDTPFAFAALIGLAGGIALAMTRGFVRLALTAVVGFFRAIPVLMLIFWTFFLMPVLLHVDVPGLATVVCAHALLARRKLPA